MRMRTLRFKELVYFAHVSDEIKIGFKFSMFDTKLIGTPEEHNGKTDHQIDVIISNTSRVSGEWNGINEKQLELILFECAKQELKKILQTRNLARKEELDITYMYPDGKLPFDPDKIEEPVGAVIVIEMNNKIGFK